MPRNGPDLRSLHR